MLGIRYEQTLIGRGACMPFEWLKNIYTLTRRSLHILRGVHVLIYERLLGALTSYEFNKYAWVVHDISYFISFLKLGSLLCIHISERVSR
ncbi:hypothetical protein CR513_54427, partial [Mucuna pruriens]